MSIEDCLSMLDEVTKMKPKKEDIKEKPEEEHHKEETNPEVKTLAQKIMEKFHAKKD